MDLVRNIILQQWWTYQSETGGTFSEIYHLFNLGEGVVWWVFAGLVLLRWVLYRRSLLEPLYAAAFISFGITDFIEAYAIGVWLLAVKAVNLAWLLWIRAVVMRRYYRGSRLY